MAGKVEEGWPGHAKARPPAPAPAFGRVGQAGHRYLPQPSLVLIARTSERFHAVFDPWPDPYRALASEVGFPLADVEEAADAIRVIIERIASA